MTDSLDLEEEVPPIFQSKYTSRQVLTKDQEKETCEYVKKSAFYKHGMTRDTFKKFVYQFITLNKISHPEIWNDGKEASEDWLYGLKKKNNTISLRKPE